MNEHALELTMNVHTLGMPARGLRSSSTEWSER